MVSHSLHKTESSYSAEEPLYHLLNPLHITAFTSTHTGYRSSFVQYNVIFLAIKHNRSEMVAVLGPYEALPYYIHTYIHIFLAITIFFYATPYSLLKKPASSVLNLVYEKIDAYLPDCKVHIPQQINLNIHRQEGLKSHTFLYVFGLLIFLLMFISFSLQLLLFLVHSFSYFLFFSI
jgi:hypothetical protein